MFISVLTLISRILGMTRDALIAFFFGTTLQADAFFVAFRPFDMVRKLFSEGTLSISFVPVFSRTLELEGRSKAFSVAFSFFCFLSVASFILIAAGMIFAPFFVRLMVPGFSAGSFEQALTILLMNMMMPYFWLILISALGMGILNCFGQFVIPGLAPVVFNLVIISFTVCLSSYFKMGIHALALGVTAGGICQAAVMVPAVRREYEKSHFRFQWFHPQVKTIIKFMIPGMIGAASYQVNIVTASFFASVLPQGSVSCLYYADRLVQFPVALFAVSAATVMLPSLSRDAALSRMEGMAKLFSNGVSLTLFITIPAMAGLMALSQPVTALLFGRGNFGPEAVRMTADCLFYLVMGIWVFTLTRLLVTLHFSLQSIRIPFISGLISIGLNIVLCAVFIKPLALIGLALSICISAAAGLLFLLLKTPGVIEFDIKHTGLSACRSVFASAIMYSSVKFTAGYLPSWQTHPAAFALSVTGCILLGVLLYLGIHILMSSPELRVLKNEVIKQ